MRTGRRLGSWVVLAVALAGVVHAQTPRDRTSRRDRMRAEGARSSHLSQPPPTARPDGAPPVQPAPTPQTTPPEMSAETGRGVTERPQVELEIECAGQPWGRIVVELYPERTPVTVRNFLQYVDEGFYDGTIFHRVLPDFLIQGGGYVSLNEPKTAGSHPAIRNESRRGPKNTRGTVAMARKRDPHSAVSQFFINVADNEQLDFPKAGAYGYCVFGKVIDGLDVVDRIKNVPTQVSPEAQRRFDRYRALGETVTQVERSQPSNPPLIKKACRVLRPIPPPPVMPATPDAAVPALPAPTPGAPPVVPPPVPVETQPQFQDLPHDAPPPGEPLEPAG